MIQPDLSPDQRRHAIEARVAELNRLRPLTGRYSHRSRKGGVAATLGRRGVRAWGLSMLNRRGGYALRDHGLEHLRRISPDGVKARMAQAELRSRRAAYDAARAALETGA